MPVSVTVTVHNANPDTVWNRLAARLGREPTNAEAKAEVLRIMRGTDPTPPVHPDYVPARLGSGTDIMRDGQWMSYAARQATGLEWMQVAGNRREGYRLEFGNAECVVEVSTDFRTVRDAKAVAWQHFGCECARGRDW